MDPLRWPRKELIYKTMELGPVGSSTEKWGVAGRWFGIRCDPHVGTISEPSRGLLGSIIWASGGRLEAPWGNSPLREVDLA